MFVSPWEVLRYAFVQKFVRPVERLVVRALVAFGLWL